MILSRRYFFAVFCAAYVPQAMIAADIVDFSRWHVVQDPADPNFTASASSSEAMLFAGSGAVAAGTDIGYATIDGDRPASSAAGFYFDPAADLTIALDYDLEFDSASGGLGLGFGVGEDAPGANSAGIAMLTLDGSPFLNFVGAARVNDVDQPVQDTGLAASLSGSLFVEYDAAVGDLILGASTTPGAGSPSATVTFAGLQNQWAGSSLMASFFIRSEAIPILAPNGWEGGDGTGTFSNFRILEGSALAIPEPASGLLLGGLGAGVLFLRRHRNGDIASP